MDNDFFYSHLQHIQMLNQSDFFFDVFVSLICQRKIKVHEKVDPSGDAVLYVSMQDPEYQNDQWIVFSRECRSINRVSTWHSWCPTTRVWKKRKGRILARLISSSARACICKLRQTGGRREHTLQPAGFGRERGLGLWFRKKRYRKDTWNDKYLQGMK
jgi:hypothetical protein